MSAPAQRLQRVSFDQAETAEGCPPHEESLEGAQYHRRASRARAVQVAEYAPYPRVSSDQRSRVAFTVDQSERGMCLNAEAAEELGTLLRIVLRGVDGRPTLDALARVVWLLPRDDGRFHMGLSVVAEGMRRMRVVRHGGQNDAIAVTA